MAVSASDGAYNDGDEDNQYNASLDSCVSAIKVHSAQVTLPTCFRQLLDAISGATVCAQPPVQQMCSKFFHVSVSVIFMNRTH